MTNKITFQYTQEFWFISAFINSVKVDGASISSKLERFIKDRISKISKKDAYREEFANELVNMAENITLSCKWVEYIPNFPYYNENTNRYYDSLGYFYFEVEYYKKNPKKKENIKANLIQQIPYIIVSEIKNKNLFLGEEVYFDLESPIYIFVTSNKTNPANIEWTEENIEKYKHTLSYWTVLYSGQWEDYSPKLFEERIQNNLSNRLSELHYINRNSGFVYMAEQNYEEHFERYMVGNVLKPSAEMRAILFSLRAINNSLDILFLNTHSEGIINVENLEEKIKNLRYLRGILQNILSKIYNELDYNRRQHYTKVLKHLVDKFDLRGVKKRLNAKFDSLYDTMQEIYQKKVQEDQEETEKALNILNFLLGAGILADLAQLLMIALSLSEGDITAVALNSTFAVIISGVLVIAILYYVFVKFKAKKEKARATVDGVILNENEDKIVLIKRKFPPFQGYYALPGGFVNKGEPLEDALKREVKEETNLRVSVIKTIGVYNDSDRDPRGDINSTVFLCKISEKDYDLKPKTDSLSVEFMPISNLDKIKLAFDHREILEDAKLIEKDSIFD